MRARRVALAVSLALLSPMLAGLAAAQGQLDHFTTPASGTQQGIKALYDLIFPISIVIGILVECVLIYAALRFRAKAKGRVQDSGERERGHHKLEIAWTLPPAAILLLVGLLSTNTLFAIDNPAVTPDFTVKVTGSQFVWTFEYPDGSVATDGMAVEVGKVVGLEIHATDVIHSFAVPTLGVKIDAIPGRVNHYWFKAAREGMFQAQCMEYCGVGHSLMRPSQGVLIVPAGSTEKGWKGPEVAAVNLSQADRVVEMRMLESGGPGGAKPWSIDPGTLQAASTETLGIRIINPAGQASPHNLTIVRASGGGEKAAAYEPGIAAGKEGAIVHKFEPGQYIYYCAIPGHRGLGMEGQLTVS